jgi:hypothetical protein
MPKVHFIHATTGLINHRRHKNLKIYFVFLFWGLLKTYP